MSGIDDSPKAPRLPKPEPESQAGLGSSEQRRTLRNNIGGVLENFGCEPEEEDSDCEHREYIFHTIDSYISYCRSGSAPSNKNELGQLNNLIKILKRLEGALLDLENHKKGRRNISILKKSTIPHLNSKSCAEAITAIKQIIETSEVTNNNGRTKDYNVDDAILFLRERFDLLVADMDPAMRSKASFSKLVQALSDLLPPDVPRLPSGGSLYKRAQRATKRVKKIKKGQPGQKAPFRFHVRIDALKT